MLLLAALARLLSGAGLKQAMKCQRVETRSAAWGLRMSPNLLDILDAERESVQLKVAHVLA